MYSELRLKKLRGSGGYVMASVTDTQQIRGNLGGPDLFLAPIGRLNTEQITKYYCNTCDKEYGMPPRIDYESPNELVAENLVLAERGRYVCEICNYTLAEYRNFKKPDEAAEVGLAKRASDVTAPAPAAPAPQAEVPVEAAPAEVVVEVPVETAPEAAPAEVVVEVPVETAPEAAPAEVVVEVPVETAPEAAPAEVVVEVPVETAPEAAPAEVVVEVPVETAPEAAPAEVVVEVPVETAPEAAPAEVVVEVPVEGGGCGPRLLRRLLLKLLK